MNDVGRRSAVSERDRPRTATLGRASWGRPGKGAGEGGRVDARVGRLCGQAGPTLVCENMANEEGVGCGVVAMCERMAVRVAHTVSSSKS